MRDSLQEYLSGIVQHLVSETTGRFGQEGLDVLKQALYKFGVQEGEKIRVKVETMGLEPNLANFLKFNKIIGIRSPEVSGTLGYEIYHCPIEDNWLDDNKIAVGRILCHLDRAMLQGYNTTIAGQHSNCIRLGSHSCYFVSRVVFAEEGNIQERRDLHGSQLQGS